MKRVSIAVCCVSLIAAPVFAGRHGNFRSSGELSAQAPRVRDPDQRFLREMIDHHEGLIYLVHAAMQRPISKKAHEVLDGFDVTEDAEKREMRDLLHSLFSDSYDGTPTERDKNAADSVLSQSGSSGFDSVASAFVISHHRRGVRLIDVALPQLKRPRVRELAVTMKKKELREIAVHQRRLNAD